MVRPLIYFSYGMTKSGSTLAFELVRNALEVCGYPQVKLDISAILPNRKKNILSHITEDDAAGMVEQVNKLGYPIVFKTHTRPDPAVVELMQSGAAVGHACYRDPRDLCLSMIDHGIKSRGLGRSEFSEIETLEDALDGVRNQSDSLTAWLRLPGTAALYYEDIAFDTRAVVRQIYKQIGLEGKAQKVVRISNRKARPTQNKMLRKRYPDEMNTSVSRAIAAEFAPMLDRLIANRNTLPRNGNIVLPPPLMLRTSATDVLDI